MFTVQPNVEHFVSDMLSALCEVYCVLYVSHGGWPMSCVYSMLSSM